MDNLTVLNLSSENTLALAAMASRTMQLQCTLQESYVMVSSKAGMENIFMAIFIHLNHCKTATAPKQDAFHTSEMRHLTLNYLPDCTYLKHTGGISQNTQSISGQRYGC